MKATLAKAQHLLNQEKPNPDKVIKLLKPFSNGQNANWIACHYLGVAELQKKRYKKAIPFFRKSIKKGSTEPETYHLLSVGLYQIGDFESAKEYAEIAVQKSPEMLKAWMHLGSVHKAMANLDEAVKCYHKANALDPRNAGVAFRIGSIYYDQSDFTKAEELFKITLKIDENYFEAALGLAKIYEQKQEYDLALDQIQYVLKKETNHFFARVALAELYKSKGDYDEAIQQYEKMLETMPHNGAIRVNYALSLVETGQFEKAERHYLHALEKSPEVSESLSNYLMGIHYNPQSNKEDIFKAHLLWDKHYAPKARPDRPVPENKEENKKLKIGLVSGGLRKHPVGWMITKSLESLPADAFEIYCYSANNVQDDVSKRIKKRSKVWRSVLGYTDEVLASLIKEDGIDILLELSGHSADNRLKTFILEPAPVQVKWVGGLFNTSGLESIDYLLTDHVETPLGEEEFYTEKLVRMPDDYICFLPPDYAPDVEELPALKNDYVTFGCFNNPAKLNPVLLKNWAEILTRVPNSRLFLKSKQYDSESFRNNIIRHMQDFGIEKSRLIFEGYSRHEDLLSAYNTVDIALDPWPYSGGLTTCEALWMGVPVISKPGPTFAGRHSATHLTNAGLADLVTETWEDYVEKAVELANDLDGLTSLRTDLRQKVSGSPLCDGELHGKNLALALREMWKHRVNGYEQDLKEGKWQDHIDVRSLSSQESATHSKPATDGESKKEMISEEVKPESLEELKTPKELIQNGVHKNGLKKKEEPFKIQTKDGVIICTPGDTKLMTPYVLLEQKQWYENEIQFVREFVSGGMNVADIGAGFGVYALPAAKLIGEKGKVFAFEPGSQSRGYLEMSKLENAFQNMEVIGKAVGEASEKGFLSEELTPELNRISDSGETISIIKLDDWWKFEGEPELDLIKIDVNGQEEQVLTGAGELLGKNSPVLLISITENENLGNLASALKEKGYILFEYVPVPGLLTEFDFEGGADSYLQNLIAVKADRQSAMKAEGWFHDENFSPKEPEIGFWKSALSQQPWTETLMTDWEKAENDETNQDYLRALDYLCAAEHVDLQNKENVHRRSEKAVLLLGAAQILIQLYNSGNESTAVSMTLIRCLTALGKRGQAVEVHQKLMESSEFGKVSQARLPFLLPISAQDATSIKTDYSKWLMVRILESWILLKDLTTYLSGEKEGKLMEGLEGNVEVTENLRNRFQLHRKNISDDFTLDTVHSSVESPNRIEKLTLLYPGVQGGAHGLHAMRAQSLANEVSKFGIETDAISASEPQFLTKILEASKNPDHAIYSGIMGFDAWLETDMNLSGNVFDLLGSKVFCSLADHPYTSFMWRRMERMPNKAVVFASTPSIAYEFKEIYKKENKVIVNEKTSPTFQVDERAKTALENRAIDILIPWGIHKFMGAKKSVRQQLQGADKNIMKLAESVYERSLDDYEKSIFEIFQSCTKQVLGHRYEFSSPLNKQDQIWLHVLSIVDWSIRRDRRLRMLNAIKNISEDKQIVITAHPQVAESIPGLVGKKNIKWVGEVSATKLNDFYSQSKIVFSCNPTFPDMIHERIRNSMAWGSAVVSDYSPILDKNFEDKQGILFTDKNGSELAEFINKPISELQSIADCGKQIIENQFTKEEHVKWLVQAIQSNLLGAE